MIHSIKGRSPRIADSAFVAWNAEVAGDASIGEEASVWFGATVRADLAPIRVGARSSVQDGAILHVDRDQPCEIGDDCTIGHGAVLHGCSVGSATLIGMGAIILNRAMISEECIVGAGALVTEGKSFPPRSLILGNPAKLVRQLSDEEAANVRANAARYVELARSVADDYAPVTLRSPSPQDNPACRGAKG
jgi:carbonic anhydrase/acetyltransferase-like protein (isoleucine patch superfamily)